MSDIYVANRKVCLTNEYINRVYPGPFGIKLCQGDGHLRMFSLPFLGRVIALDVMGQHLKAQPFTLKTLNLRFYLKQAQNLCIAA